MSAQKLMKNAQVSANEIRKGEYLEASHTSVSQDFDYVLHQPQPAASVQCQNRFGVKLHCFHRQIPVAYAHDHAVLALGGYLQAFRKLLRNRIERMIASHADLFR